MNFINIPKDFHCKSVRPLSPEETKETNGASILTDPQDDTICVGLELSDKTLRCLPLDPDSIYIPRHITLHNLWIVTYANSKGEEIHTMRITHTTWRPTKFICDVMSTVACALDTGDVDSAKKHLAALIELVPLALRSTAIQKHLGDLVALAALR